MSQQNVDLIRQAYAWVRAGDSEKAFEVYDPDVEWDSSRAPWLLELGFDPVYRGHEGVRAALRTWLEAWESIDYRPEELIDAGDEVLAFVRIVARGRASGIAIEYDHPQLWTLRDGKIIRMRVFADRDEAFEAAGLSESGGAPARLRLRRSTYRFAGPDERDDDVDNGGFQLKARHRAMWASGDYPAMVETFLLPLGPKLVEACAIGAGMKVLDVAAGTGNASIPAAEAGADVTASDLTPELFEAGRARADAKGVELEWAEADAENLPFDDGSFDVVMSSIGAMFAPRHRKVADEMVRVCRRGGTIGMLNWTPEGMIGALFRTMGPFAPPPPPGAQPPPLWGGEDHVRELFGDRVDLHTLRREVLEIVAFKRPRDYGEHFKAYYGPTITARANAAKDGREGDLDAALDAFCDEWNLGSEDDARFEQEYLVVAGTRS